MANVIVDSETDVNVPKFRERGLEILEFTRLEPYRDQVERRYTHTRLVGG